MLKSFIHRVSSVGISAKPPNKELTNQKLLEACRTNDIQSCRQTLIDGANVNCEDASTGFTPLKYACYYQYKAIVEVLIAQPNITIDYVGGSNYISSFQDFAPPLLCATETLNQNCDVSILEMLLKAGASPNCESMAMCTTPLFVAVKNENMAAIDLLLQECTLDLTHINGASWNILHQAAFYSQTNPQILTLLLSKIDGECINTESTRGDTPLHLVCQSWPWITETNRQKIQTLLHYGADPYSKNKFGQTPMDMVEDTSVFSVVKFSVMNSKNSDIMIPGTQPIARSNSDSQIASTKLMFENENLKSKIDEISKEMEKMKEQMQLATMASSANSQEEIPGHRRNDSLDRARKSKKIELSLQDRQAIAMDVLLSRKDFLEFEKWWVETVRLDRSYVTLLDEMGYADLRIVDSITESDLEEAGITRKGHRKIILRCVKKYVDSEAKADEDHESDPPAARHDIQAEGVVETRP